MAVNEWKPSIWTNEDRIAVGTAAAIVLFFVIPLLLVLSRPMH